MNTVRRTVRRLLLRTLGALLLAVCLFACGRSAAATPAPREEPDSIARVEGYEPLARPSALIEGEDPVGAFLAFAAAVLERARVDPRFADVGRTPEELLAFLARAEREGDWASFAAGLDAPKGEHLAWAACMLLPQVARAAHARWLELCERRFGAQAELTRMARGAWGMRPQGLSRARVRLGVTSGFFLPDGTCMMRIRKTKRGWRVAALTPDEREVQPANGLPRLLVDLAAWECALATCPPEGVSVDARALLGQVQEHLGRIQRRIASHPVGTGR